MNEYRSAFSWLSQDLSINTNYGTIHTAQDTLIVGKKIHSKILHG